MNYCFVIARLLRQLPALLCLLFVCFAVSNGPVAFAQDKAAEQAEEPTEENEESTETEDKKEKKEKKKSSSKKKSGSAPAYNRAAYQPALVLLEGSKGSGTGFICKIQGIPFLVTNIHVLGCADAARSYDNGFSKLSARTLDGKQLTLLSIFGAEDHDLCIIRFAEEADFVDIALDFEPAVGNSIHVDDDIVIPGNSQGAGTMVWTEGQVVGIGPLRVEHDAPVYQGNSGSPIIHIKSGKVIGVLSYAEQVSVDSFVEKNSFKDDRSAIRKNVRYFGFRIDSPQNWYEIQLPRFARQNDEHNTFIARRKSMASFLYTDGGGWRNDDLISALIDDADDELRRRSIQGRVNRETFSQVTVSLARRLDGLIKDDVYRKYQRYLRSHKARASGSQEFYPYFTESIDREVKIRDHLSRNLREIETRLQKYR